MNKIRAVRTFVVFWLPGGMFINFILLFFVDGNRKITIVNKRLKHRASKHNTRPEATSCKEYIVDVRMGMKKKSRSLYCSLSMYKKFREGETYEVVVKRNRIKSIVEPGKQSELTKKVVEGVKLRSVAMSISANLIMPMGDSERLDEYLSSREDNPDNTINYDENE